MIINLNGGADGLVARGPEFGIKIFANGRGGLPKGMSAMGLVEDDQAIMGDERGVNRRYVG